MTINEKKPRCFMLEPCAKVTDDLAEFGDIVFMFKRSDSRPSIFSERFQALVEQRLRELEFDPEYDYFVMTGYMIGICVVVSVLSRMFVAFDTLIFHAPTSSYTEVTLGTEVPKL